MTDNARQPSGPATNRFLGVFRYSRRALELVWSTSARLAVVLAVFTLIAGVLPAGAAWVGQLIVDGVVAAIMALGRAMLAEAEMEDEGTVVPDDYEVLVV